MKTFKTLTAAAALLLTGSLGAHAAFTGAAGYVYAAHVGNLCAQVYITPNPGSPIGGAWFGLDLSPTTTLTPQAVSAQVAILLGAANAQNLALAVGIQPTKLGLDFDPTQTVVCNWDAEGSGPVTGHVAKNFNYPFSPHQ